MPPEIRDIVPHLALLLVGGVGTSLAVARLARSSRGRRAVAGVHGAWIVGVGVVAVALAAGALYWMWRRIVSVAAEAGGPDVAGSVVGAPSWSFLVLGVLLALPLSLPSVLEARSRERRKGRRGERRAPATKDERREFADGLARQIRELSPEPRQVRASIRGDGGRVLELAGDVSREEGDRLARALEDDLQELGFRRIEGARPDGTTWWARIGGGSKTES